MKLCSLVWVFLLLSNLVPNRAKYIPLPSLIITLIFGTCLFYKIHYFTFIQNYPLTICYHLHREPGRKSRGRQCLSSFGALGGQDMDSEEQKTFLKHTSDRVTPMGHCLQTACMSLRWSPKSPPWLKNWSVLCCFPTQVFVQARNSIPHPLHDLLSPFSALGQLHRRPSCGLP